MIKSEKLLLIDAHAVLHRAYHALPDFRSAAGEPTGALYGLSTFLMKAIKDITPDYIIAAYDLPEPTFRKQVYEGYKAQRPKMDDDLALQITRSHDIFEAFGVPIYAKSGFEADDILGTIVYKIKNQKLKIKAIIASGDMDTLQLVDDDNVVVYTLKKGINETVVYNEPAVKARYGFGPKLVPDYKGLSGDPSDNIIGVKGIGEKTATELITKFGTLENIYKNLNKVEKERVRKLLEDNEEEAMFSKTLATIRRDAPIDFKLPPKWEMDKEKVIKAFGELGFKSLINRLGGEVKVDKPEIPEGVAPVYEKIEKPLTPILRAAEKRGIKVDVEYLKKLSQEYHGELDKLQKKIYELAGIEFNINSPKQMSEVLFEKLKLPKNTKGSTKISVLESLEGKHPIIPEIIKYRELAKLLSTYVDALPEAVGEDGRVHTTFNQYGASTGRISSDNPNLQNIPARSELGRKIRRAFVAEGGFKLVSFDYSQIELRVTAMLSREEKMIKFFKEGGDIHAGVASEVFGVPPDKVTSEMRRQAKVINFGILYGMGVNALRANLGVSREEAKKFYNKYFERFGKLAHYLEKIKEEARKKGYTETMFGRRRYFKNLKSKIEYVRAAEERMAVNAPLQGTAADIIKIAMVRADQSLKAEKLGQDAHLLLQVHDELVYEIREEVVDKAAKIIKYEMGNVLEHPLVPIDMKVAVGDNWNDLKEFKI